MDWVSSAVGPTDDGGLAEAASEIEGDAASFPGLAVASGVDEVGELGAALPQAATSRATAASRATWWRNIAEV